MTGLDQLIRILVERDLISIQDASRVEQADWEDRMGEDL